MIAVPEKNGHHQLPWGMNVRAWDRMLPHVGVVVTPKPRKLTNASLMMLPAMIREAATTRSEERRVGKECRSRWSPYH